jgi:peptidoglycan/xylan/chitin deacetylase (PgdA/CDA1 family)
LPGYGIKATFFVLAASVKTTEGWQNGLKQMAMKSESFA